MPSSKKPTKRVRTRHLIFLQLSNFLMWTELGFLKKIRFPQIPFALAIYLHWLTFKKNWIEIMIMFTIN